MYPCVFNRPDIINTNEIFVPVYNNYGFMVSNFGRIFNCDTGRFLYTENRIGDYGIYAVELGDFVHNIVMRSFNYYKGCENMYVNHIDTVWSNNCLPNLEYSDVCTDNNKFNSGVHHHKAILTKDIVRGICEDLEKEELTLEEIAKKNGVSVSCVFSIKTRSSWKNISKDYHFTVDAKAHRNIKYPDELVKQICKDLENDKYLPLFEICNKYNVPKNVVQSIAAGKTRTDISCKYNLGNPKERNYNFRNKAKKEKVRELLKTTNMSVNEIAAECNVTPTIVYNLNSKEKIRTLIPSNQYIAARNNSQ